MSVTHDIETIVSYVDTNWNVSVVKPESIHHYDSDSPVRYWMYKRSIELNELDTQYSLADITGNIDAINDTLIDVLVFSKTAPVGGKAADHTLLMYNEFLKQIRTLAKLDNINVYAYLQSTQIKDKVHTPFWARIRAVILLTRRGVGHDIS